MKFGVTTSQLRKWNSLTSNKIVTGKSLTVYSQEPESFGDNTSKSNANIINYTIKKGDTIGEIAEKFKVNTSEIKNWNNLRSNSIVAGKSLKIYSDANISNVNSNSSDDESNSNEGFKTNSSNVVHYIVKKGDTIGHIANKYRVNTYDLRSWNNISGSRINVGQELIIKTGESSTSVNSPREKETIAQKLHKVRNGESLWTIAKKYNVTVRNIMDWNNLNNERIRIGSNLKILN